MADILLASLILTPLALAFLIRSNGALAFLAACGGFAAYSLAGSELHELATNLGLKGVKQEDFGLFLVVALPILTLLFTFHSVTGKYKIVAQGVAGLLAGAFMAFVSAPFLNETAGINIVNSSLWSTLQSTHAYVAGAGVIYSLVLVWFFHGHKKSKKHK